MSENDFTPKGTDSYKSMKKRKIANVLKKILLYTVIAIVVLLALVIAYQIFEMLFTLAILILAWLCPKRWR